MNLTRLDVAGFLFRLMEVIVAAGQFGENETGTGHWRIMSVVERQGFQPFGSFGEEDFVRKRRPSQTLLAIARPSLLRLVVHLVNANEPGDDDTWRQRHQPKGRQLRHLGSDGVVIQPSEKNTKTGRNTQKKWT
jgi:hypothetical protein